VAIAMTQQYIVGELSSRIAALESLAPEPSWRASLELVRRDSERRSPRELGAAARQVLAVVDGWCRDSLRRGDIDLFVRQCAASSEVWEFAVCSGLIDDRIDAGREADLGPA
jgi:hypothetical protein